MEAFKAFMKPFEAPQGSVKIKSYVNFYFIQLSEMRRTGRVKKLYESLDIL